MQDIGGFSELGLFSGYLKRKAEADTFITLEPSVWKRIRLPVISVG